MDSAEQAEGEKRVRQVLIEPLLRRGLSKPTNLTRGQWEDSLTELQRKLAYMAPDNLAALEEIVAANPAGKERDRIPIANAILGWAGQIQPPPDDGSPLMRAVFRQQLGRAAITGGWAPELLAELRQHRRWPNAFAVKQIRDRAEPAIRQMNLCERAMARGDDLSATEAEWYRHRKAILAKCVAMGGGE